MTTKTKNETNVKEQENRIQLFMVWLAGVFIMMGLVDAIPMIAVGLAMYVMFAVA